jgi:RecA/RadA recombinase
MARVKVEDPAIDPVPKKGGGIYFTTPKSDVKFIPSGCKMLDLALGGGWARGRIANIVGDKSTGKCIRNAYVQSGRGFERLDDFGEREGVAYGSSEFVTDLALNSKRCVKTSHFWKDNVQTTLQITTKHGYNIEGTFNHKIMIWTKDCSFIMKKLSDLQIGDVAVIAKSPQNSDDKKLRSIGYKRIKSKMDSSSLDIKIPTHVSESLAELLGFYVADGNTAGRSLNFSNTKTWFRTRFLKDMKDVFGLHEKDISYKEVNGSGTFSIYRTQLFDLFNYLFDGQLKTLTARYKYIPKCIMQSPKNVQAAFLRGLIDCDSENAINGVVYSTASKQLAEQVHLLLLNFGVVANKQCDAGPGKYSDHLYWDIAFWGKYASIYDEVVGYGRGKLKTGKHIKSDFDIIPYLSDKLSQDIETARRCMGWSKNGKTKFGRFPTFQLVAENVNFENLNHIINAFSKIPEWFNLSLYRYLQESDYHFDPIKEIKTLEKQVDVYDVHVPDGHLFWANGFVNHNTLLAIEVAANFNLIEPKGKIRYREAESAFDNAYAAALGFPVDKVDFGDPIDTIEDVFEDLEKIIKGANGPEIYILDSLDALSDRAEMERKIDEGSYGTGKAKMLSQMFRRLVRDLADKDITIFIVSQIRDNIGVMIGKKTTRSGGRALDFYASQILFLSQIRKLDKTISNIKRITGVEIKGMVEKNKIGLPYRDAMFKILFGYGIHDWQACADYMKTVTGEIIPKSMPIEQLHGLVEASWWEIEKKFMPNESKYGGV